MLQSATGSGKSTAIKGVIDIIKPICTLVLVPTTLIAEQLATVLGTTAIVAGVSYQEIRELYLTGKGIQA